MTTNSPDYARVHAKKYRQLHPTVTWTKARGRALERLKRAHEEESQRYLAEEKQSLAVES